MYIFSSTRQPLAGLNFCMFWFLCFRVLLIEILMMWQRNIRLSYPDMFLRRWNSYFEESFLKDRGWKEDFSWDMALDFRVIFSSKLFNLHNYSHCHNYISKITFSRDNRHFQFELNQENLVHTGFHQFSLYTYIHKNFSNAL